MIEKYQVLGELHAATRHKMKTITKIVLSNFKRFETLDLQVDEALNILIGDNEAGKSSILLALDLVLSGSVNKVETIGFESIFNVGAINQFLTGPKKIADLPKLFVEVYFTEQNNSDLHGFNNSKEIPSDGLRLDCEPVDEYGKEILEALSATDPIFPFEYYRIKFTTFADQPYSGYKKFVKHLVIDSSQINNEYATREYTKTIYGAHANVLERNKHENLYRKSKSAFKASALSEVNAKLDDYKFAVRTGTKSNLAVDLIITEDDIPIEGKGKGRQCFIKTEFALSKNDGEHQLDILLLEEPENHLSHVHINKLIQRISDSKKKQLFIATHSSLVCSRLNLRNAVLLNSSGANPVGLKHLTEDTAKFFMKAPDNSVLEFVLAKKALLVEGDAEFILMDAFYKKQPGGTTPEADGVHVIPVGTSFKRYMELAKLLGIRTAVVRDNDKNYDANCVASYAGHVADGIKVFSDPDNGRWTFEICIYQDNTASCDALFSVGRKSLSVQDFMLANKADAAFELLEKAQTTLVAPVYIQDAIAWIKE